MDIAEKAIEQLAEICKRNISISIRTLYKIIDSIEDPDKILDIEIDENDENETHSNRKLIKPYYVYENPSDNLHFAYDAYKSEIKEEFFKLEKKNAINNFIDISIHLNQNENIFYYICIEVLDKNKDIVNLDDEIIISIITKDHLYYSNYGNNCDTYEYLIAVKGE